MVRKQNDLGKDDIKQLVKRLAIPSMLAQFVNVLYSIVDRMYIGNIKDVGEIALAGAGVCGPIVTLISSFAFWSESVEHRFWQCAWVRRIRKVRKISWQTVL